MSITPIELATMAPKSQETALAKNAEVQKPTNDQMNALRQVEAHAFQNTNTTVRPKQSDTPEFRYDARDGGGSAQGQMQGDSGRKKDKIKKNDSKKKKNVPPIGGFDIRI